METDQRTEEPGGPRWTTGSLLRQRSVASAMVALLVSATGAIALTVALGVQVYDITGNKLDLGWLGLAEFLPTAVLVLVTGTVADRYDRRLVMAIGLGVEALVVGWFALIARGHPTSVLPLYVGTVLFGSARAFVAPAIRSLIPASAPDHAALPRVVALSSGGWQIGGIMGPLIGAWFYDLAPWHAYEAVFVLLMASIVAVMTVPSSVGRAHVDDDVEMERPSIRSALEGLRVIKAKPILLGAITLDLFAVLFGGAVALLPAIAKDVLHGGAAQVGIMRTAGGVGAAIVTISLASKPLTRRVGRWLLCAVALFGAATIVLGVSRSIVVAVLAMFVLNGADSVSVFVRSTLVPLVTPPEQRGRVLAVEAVFIGGSNELGAFESGVVAGLAGTTFAVVSGGVAVLAIIALFWFAFPSLRDVNRFEDLTTRPADEVDAVGVDVAATDGLAVAMALEVDGTVIGVDRAH